MSKASRVIYLLVGLLIAVSCGWMTVVAVNSLSQDTNHSALGIPTSVWIGTLGSLSASGVFFSLSETLRWMFDETVSRNHQRLKFYEDTLGIKDCFSQKGSDAANLDYGKAIASAKHRVWAFGISNGEFLSEHLPGLIAKKKRIPALDICICFIDPKTTISIGEAEGITKFSQVQLYDITRDAGLMADNSTRVANRVTDTLAEISKSNVDISIKLVSVAGYVSAMVVDDIIYVFPFTAISKDNTRTPYLKIAVASQIGQAFYSYFESIKAHSRLSRPPS